MYVRTPINDWRLQLVSTLLLESIEKGLDLLAGLSSGLEHLSCHRTSWNLSQPWTSNLFSPNKKVRQRTPVKIHVADDPMRHASDG